MPTSNSQFLFKSIRKLISDSNTHSGLRVLLAMTMTFIPVLTTNLLSFFTQNSLHISISLCLGVMASAIVETDDNYKGRGKFIATIVLCFFIAASSVELLIPYPVFFALGLFVSSFIFMMLATLGTHFSKIGFGTILIAIYTMIGHQSGINWYEQPLLLSIGALWYGLFSIIWNFYSPYRSLREQLAQLFFSLSRYQQQKSALFNEKEGSSQEGIFSVRQQLAILNIAIMARFDQSKRIIQSRFNICQKQAELKKLQHYYFIAEQLHERICASQYLYSELESTFAKSQILEGFHQLLLQLSDDCYQLGTAINDKKKYHHSRRLQWTVNALSDQLYLLKQKSLQRDQNSEAMLALQAIYNNIAAVNDLLLALSQNKQGDTPADITAASIRPSQSVLRQLFTAIHKTNPVFKHAIRISVSLTIAFALQQSFHLQNGFWLLLTVLFVCQPSFSETRKRLVQRSFGTLLGIFIGYFIMIFVEGLFAQVLLLLLSAFLFFNYLRTNYALAVVFITLFVLFLFNLLTGSGIDILPARIAETLLGCGLSILAITFIFPDWQFQRFPSLVNNLLMLSSNYFKLIGFQYQHGRNENSNYRQIRFNTFNSDAALTSAWQSMLFEPRSKQKLTREVYALVNRCDALVSYIAALASHRHKMHDFENCKELQDLLRATEEQLTLTYQPLQFDDKKSQRCIDKFENIKIDLSGEQLLIVEQLRLIAFTALDIQLLLQQVNFKQTQTT